MVFGPITSWQINGEATETVRDFIVLDSKITADGDCSHEIKKRLLPGRKVMTNLDSILKSRDITLPTKICLVKAMVFPVVMYGCESWTINNVECQRIDAFELWCWRRLLKSPLDCKEIQPVHPKGNQFQYSLEGLMLKMKLQSFGHLMRRTDSLEKTLTVANTDGRRSRGRHRMRWLDGITDAMDMRLQELVMDKEDWHTAVHEVPKNQTRLSDWTELDQYNPPGFSSNSENESHSVVSNSLRPPGLYSPWNSPGQNTRVASLSLLQVIFQPRDWTQVSCFAGGFFTRWATRKTQDYRHG